MSWDDDVARVRDLALRTFSHDRDALGQVAEALVDRHRATMPCPLTGPAMAAWADAVGIDPDPRLRRAVQQAGILRNMAERTMTPAPGHILPDDRGEQVARCAADLLYDHGLRFSVGQTADAVAARLRGMGWTQDGAALWVCPDHGGRP